MPNYGQLRMQLQQDMPGVLLERIDGWIQDAYTEALDLIPWKRQEAESVIQAPLGYSAGSLTASQGVQLVTGSGVNWSTNMNGRMIRIANQNEYYQFTQASGTTANLDRVYEASTNAVSTTTLGAAGTGYAVGDVFNILAGNSQAQGVILTVSNTGAVTQYEVNLTGSGYSVANGIATSSSGVGTGFTINVTAIDPTSSGLTYRIDQNIYLLPADCRILRAVRPLHDRLRPLQRVTPEELNNIAAQRLTYGTPRYFCPTWDSFGDPPQMQVEFYPIPSVPDSAGSILSWAVEYDFDAGAIDATNTSGSLLPWMRPAMLVAGVKMRAYAAASTPDLTRAQWYKTEFEALIKQALMNNAYQRGNTPVRLAPQFRRQHPVRYRRGPKHIGFTG